MSPVPVRGPQPGSQRPSARGPAAGALLAWLAGGALAAAQAAASGATAASSPPLQPPLPSAAAPAPCRLPGLAQAVQCGRVLRALDPSRPDGPQIAVHYAVLPALARHKAADPVFFLAGGPGQSAVQLAPALAAAYGKLNRRRDLVFVDQRGTGRSAPLACPDDDPAATARLPLGQRFDSARQAERLRACRSALQALPHGDLRQYTTPLAVADLDAVRAALGAERINAIGASYGTRVGLEYLRQFPQRLRRLVLDGVAPADMRLPDSAAADNQAALDALLRSCQADAACNAAWPDLAGRWQALLSSLPRTVRLPHPVSGRDETVTLDRDGLLSLVRGPLYAPSLAAGLPAALAEAAADRWAPLAALADALAGGRRSGEVALYSGMHLSVVCSEDVGAGTAADAAAAGDFGDSQARRYREACAGWPRAALPAGYTAIGTAPAPVWLLSGGIDPVTPPRHADRVAKALGPNARHHVVAHAGHGVANLPCVRDAVQRFVGTERDDEALALSLDCAAGTPRPLAFLPPGWAAPRAPAAPAAAASGVGLAGSASAVGDSAAASGARR